ncbi:MAG: hypothetical protein ACERKN_20580 [Velocimicrobium sp.]
MKNRRFILFALTLVLLIALVACSDNSTSVNKPVSSSKHSGKIYLYGEEHGVEKILDKEFELWCDYYENKNMRHLFVELPYYTAELLNVWMKSDSDEIFDSVYDDWKGSASYNSYTMEFYKKIKSNCPETIFHGTDVGHQYDTTGKRYLNYLEENNLKDSKQYLLAQDAIEQGEYYYKNSDDVYRENKMVENFIREFDNVSDETIMGIYGQAHTGLDAMNFTNDVPCMANQLKEAYGNIINSEDLTWIAKDIEPTRVDTIEIGGKNYEASYFGKENLTGFKDYSYREFWRLENAYNDFKDKSKTGDVLPCDNYPMLIETGQVFVIDYTKTDGSIERLYYRSDGTVWNDMLSTEALTAIS